MFLWWFMLICDSFIPIIMILCGKMLWKHYPKSINSLFGYRTKRSMQNIDTWKFANQYIGKLWWKIGWIILAPSLLIHILTYGTSEHTIEIVGTILEVIQLAVLVGAIIPTEKALKNNFHPDGTKKQAPISSNYKRSKEMAKQDTNCEYCNNFIYDEDADCYVCDMNLDEDEMGRFLSGHFTDCPYYQSNDEYEVVRHQI